jgi:hypothetical protein
MVASVVELRYSSTTQMEKTVVGVEDWAGKAVPGVVTLEIGAA